MTEMQVRERTERLLEKSGRITPRQVLEAYEETGFLPRTGDFYDGEFACALGALVCYRHGAVYGYIDEFLVRLERQAGRGYFMGYWQGFDGIVDIDIDDIDRRGQGFATGYRDGQRVRRFVFGIAKLR